MRVLAITFFILIVAVTIKADLIKKIEVRTADCDDCGMSNTFGDLRMEVFELSSS